MRNKIAVLCLMLFILALVSNTFAQKTEIRIAKAMMRSEAFPGQLVPLYLEGIGENPMTLIPSERFQITVSQGGASYAAKVRSATPAMLNTKYYAKLNASAQGDVDAKTEKIDNQQPPVLTPYQEILYMLPLGLREGEASVVVSYRNNRSDEFQFKVVNKPITPRLDLGIKTIGKPQNQSPNTNPLKSPLTPIFERGQDEEINLSPLVDPETPDSAILVTFKQQDLKREVFAKIIRNDPNSADSNGPMMFGPVRYIVSVNTPMDLHQGEAEIEVRLRANGLVSEPGSMKIEVADFSKAEAIKPIVLAISQPKIGFGQPLVVIVNDIKRLVPNPSETRIILEQNSQRIVLKPERNSAEYLKNQEISMPVLLIVRINKELIGEVKLRVYHPGRGEQAGLSDAVPLEIVSDVLPPQVKKVAESSAQDLAPLRAIRQQALDSGREFPEFNPNHRYVTITASGLDFNPRNVRIQFSQSGKTYALKVADFSLNTNEQLIVKLPEAIEPGNVQISIQNIGDGKLSEAVIKEFEVTKPGRN